MPTKRPHNSKQFHPATLARAATYQKALELRIAGHSFLRIARQLGQKYPTDAENAVRRGLELMLKPASEELRALELARLDRLLEAWWPKAITTVKDDGGEVRYEAGDGVALQHVLAILDRRFRLTGLEKLARQESEDARTIIMGILKRVITEDDAGARQEETTLAVASWRPADVTGEVVVTDDRPPRLPAPPSVEEDAEPSRQDLEADYRPLEGLDEGAGPAAGEEERGGE
jgi:hypothetical protein